MRGVWTAPSSAVSCRLGRTSDAALRVAAAARCRPLLLAAGRAELLRCCPHRRTLDTAAVDPRRRVTDRRPLLCRRCRTALRSAAPFTLVTPAALAASGTGCLPSATGRLGALPGALGAVAQRPLPVHKQPLTVRAQRVGPILLDARDALPPRRRGQLQRARRQPEERVHGGRLPSAEAGPGRPRTATTAAPAAIGSLPSVPHDRPPPITGRPASITYEYLSWVLMKHRPPVTEHRPRHRSPTPTMLVTEH